MYSQAGAGILLVVYDAQVVGGRLAAGDDARAARLCALNALPPQPRHHGGTLLEGWFLSVIEALLAQPSRVITTDAPAPQEQAAGTGADASERARSLRSHVRGLEQRLADLAAEMDAAREDMAEAAIDDGKIREVGQLKREIEHWRGELAALQEAS